MNRRACTLQAQSPGARDDARAEALRSNAERCTKRRARVILRIAIRPCSAAPGNTARSGQRRSAPERWQKFSGKDNYASTPGENFLCRVELLLRTQPKRKEKGARKPPFFAAAQGRRRTNARHGHAPSLGGCGRRCGTAHSSDVGRYPSRLSAPHETMLGAFPFPGRRAQAGEPETRLFAGLAPHARAISPAVSSGKAPDPDFCAR